MYCSKCGKQMDDSATFCSGCGAPLQNQINYAVPDINKARKPGFGVAALVLGIVGVLAWIIPITGLPVGIIALVLGIIGLKKSSKGMSIVGIVLGIICLVLTIINSAIGGFYGTTEAIKMKFGMRTPCIKKSIKARTTGKAKRVVKKALIPGYGKKGAGWIKNQADLDAFKKMYGIDGAIHRAAGPGLLAECRTLHGCETGEAKITKAYNLPCDYVIHTVGPIWNGGRNREEELLANCYFNSMKLAMDNGIRSIAFPSISTGVYSFPVELAAKIAVHTVNRFLQDKPDWFDLVEWVLFDTHTESVYESEVDKIY